MTLHPRIACVLLALAAACGDDTASSSASASGTESTGASGTTGGGATTGDATATTSGPATTSASGTTTDGTSDGTTAAASSTDPTGATSTTSTTGDTTGEPGTSGSTGEPGSTGGSTGGAEQCGVDGEDIDAVLVHGDGPAPCGPLEFTGQLVSDPKGPAWVLDGCPCGANCLKPDPWSFTMTAPLDWLPVLPVCPRIVVERQMGFGVCEFVGVSIWDNQAQNAPAFYHAGHGFQVVAAAQKELKVAESEVKTCDCDFCCSSPILWDIAFDHLGNQATVAEGQTAALEKFTAINFEAHSSGICDDTLAVHWAVRQDP